MARTLSYRWTQLIRRSDGPAILKQTQERSPRMAGGVEARPIAVMSDLFQLRKSVIVQNTLKLFRAGRAQGK